MNELRIVYDDQADDIIKKVNAVLASRGLRFVDDGESHEGFVLYRLEESKDG